MKNEIGGWIFHTKIDFNKPTPWITLETQHPKVMKEWINKRENNE